MSYMKIFFPILLTSIFIFSCKKKNQNPEEYFSFYANGVKYEYPQEKKHGFLGEDQSLFAGPSSGSLGYFITAKNPKEPVARGRITFNFPGSEIPSQDTIILDGVSNRTTIEKFLNSEAFYKLTPPQKGIIIFTERTNQMLSGT